MATPRTTRFVLGLDATQVFGSQRAREPTRWEPLSLDHPAAFIVQVVVAGIIPVGADLAALVWPRLRWLGLLRLLHVLLLEDAFDVLDRNL